MRRIEGLRIQLDAVAYLKSIKTLLGVTYRDLAALLDIPESVLSRYATGDILPSLETAQIILEKLEGKYPLTEIVKGLIKTYEEYIDMSFLNLPAFWQLYEIYLARRFSGLAVDKVLTAAVDGVPLAVAAASRFSAMLVVAKQYREPGEKNYEYTYLRGGRPVTLYIPASCIKKGDSVLIIDDIARTGKTLKALAELTIMAGGHVAGASVLVAKRDVKIELGCPVDVITYL